MPNSFLNMRVKCCGYAKPRASETAETLLPSCSIRDYKLGFIPRGHNHDISKYLDMGLHDIYEVRITRLTPDVQPEQQVEVIVNILNQK